MERMLFIAAQETTRPLKYSLKRTTRFPPHFQSERDLAEERKRVRHALNLKRAKRALRECSLGNFTDFDELELFVDEEPFNSNGLRLSEKRYRALKAQAESKALATRRR